LDFLAQIQTGNSGKNGKAAEKKKCEQLVIECKSTTGKLVTTIPNSNQYSYQVQTYMYILNRAGEVEKCSQMKRAVMIVRHYHQGGNPPRDSPADRALCAG
jgi:hypothetical protein